MLRLGSFQKSDVLTNVSHKQHRLIFRQEGSGASIVNRHGELKAAFRHVPELTFLKPGEYHLPAIFDHVFNGIHVIHPICELAPTEGIEPPAYGFGDHRSTRLSYVGIVRRTQNNVRFMHTITVAESRSHSAGLWCASA
ncbi:protein of unknown function [Acidithiobacillus ferrivorans]|uniref:Uncharacterized protein n=1 Tax=Acidithiobacillus ferrivorans TaxID=160808 RepID=A0A060UQ46_9PROT|nr:hypothetical protein AFERRI_400311 [Acidithiobacillus ferrivorans]SMH64560.1 protein of unknown function [Acidithiobacillus ferrivorans]